jgi:two-component system, OmpR family, catabolic regulation response regulator CreB
MKPTLWLVEDEPSIADTLIYTLESEGFQVRWFERGEPALQALAQGRPRWLSSMSACRISTVLNCVARLLSQAADLPVLFLTARSDELDRLIGLEIGADDYVAKPFSPREVSARVRTILRRLQKQQRLQQPHAV